MSKGCAQEDNGGRDVHLVWRPKVVQWYYNFVDELSEDRRVVYIAVNILDRFCQSISQPVDEKTYELSALASVFLAVRIGGSVNLELDYLASMSRLSISVQDLVNAGTQIINCLKWEDQIVTPHEFIHRFATLLPKKEILNNFQSVVDAALYIVEIGLCDYYLSRCEPSELGAAALLIAMGSDNHKMLHSFSEALYLSESIIGGSERMRKIRNRLHDAYKTSSSDPIKVQEEPHVIEDDEQPLHYTNEHSLTYKQHQGADCNVHVILPDN